MKLDKISISIIASLTSGALLSILIFLFILINH